jgi:5'-3' exonuclease
MTMPRINDRVLLVDGDNLLVRAIKAIEGGSGMSAAGFDTGPMMIFVNTLSRYVRDVKPTRLAVCWDSTCHWRRALWPQYKAQRPGGERNPDAYRLTKTFLSLAGIHHIARPGWEADDLIAAYWRLHRFDAEKWILSSDKDLLQLVDAMTKQIRVSSADTPTDVWDVARVQEKYGVPPRHLSAAMALIGDTADGIPGVRGIGPKTAVKLIDTSGLKARYVEDDRLSASLSELRTWQALIDLRDPPELAHEKLLLPLVPYFRPTGPTTAGYADLMIFLTEYNMMTIVRRLQEGRLW